MKKPRINQLIEIRYEIPTVEGHIITLTDSYHNRLGQINERFDERTGKFEYTFYDHEGKPMIKSEDLDRLRREIYKHKTVLLEQAHQRRIAKKLNKSVAPNHPSRKAKREKRTPSQIIAKEAKAIAGKVTEESKEILNTVTDFVTGEATPHSREEELAKLRHDKGLDREQELNR